MNWKSVAYNFVLIFIGICIAHATSQDFIKGEQAGGPVNLSGLSPDIFDGAFFGSTGWVFDTTSYSLTSSQAAFLKDNAADGKPIGQNLTPLRCGRGPA